MPFLRKVPITIAPKKHNCKLPAIYHSRLLGGDKIPSYGRGTVWACPDCQRQYRLDDDYDLYVLEWHLMDIKDYLPVKGD